MNKGKDKSLKAVTADDEKSIEMLEASVGTDENVEDAYGLACTASISACNLSLIVGAVFGLMSTENAHKSQQESEPLQVVAEKSAPAETEQSKVPATAYSLAGLFFAGAIGFSLAKAKKETAPVNAEENSVQLKALRP